MRNESIEIIQRGARNVNLGNLHLTDSDTTAVASKCVTCRPHKCVVRARTCYFPTALEFREQFFHQSRSLRWWLSGLGKESKAAGG